MKTTRWVLDSFANSTHGVLGNISLSKKKEGSGGNIQGSVMGLVLFSVFINKLNWNWIEMEERFIKFAGVMKLRDITRMEAGLKF